MKFWMPRLQKRKNNIMNNKISLIINNSKHNTILNHVIEQSTFVISNYLDLDFGLGSIFSTNSICDGVSSGTFSIWTTGQQ